jgi:hypothetical protein
VGSILRLLAQNQSACMQTPHTVRELAAAACAAVRWARQWTDKRRCVCACVATCSWPPIQFMVQGTKNRQTEEATGLPCTALHCTPLCRTGQPPKLAANLNCKHASAPCHKTTSGNQRDT